MKHPNGFTLYETLLVLVMLSVLIGGLALCRGQQDEYILANFVEVLEQDLSLLKLQSSTFSNSYQIRFGSRYYRIYHSREGLMKQVDYPPRLRLTSTFPNGIIEVYYGMLTHGGEIELTLGSTMKHLKIIAKSGMMEVV